LKISNEGATLISVILILFLIEEIFMPSSEYNRGFDDGEADRLAERERRDVSGEDAEYQQGYEHGYTGVS